MKRSIFFPFILLAAASFFLHACKGEGAKTDDKTVADSTAAVPEPAPAEITMSPVSPSPDFPDAAIKSMDCKGGKWSYKIGGSTYKLGEQTPDAPQKMCANSAEGQHIHLIVDDSAYVAKYTAEFDHKVADGEHYLCSFLSRSYHESLKHKGAGVVKKVTVKDGSITKSEDVKQPMVFYSRPKGSYVGKAETDKVMLDFYVANAELSPGGNTVKVLVNGKKEFTADLWKPVFLEGLPMGDNKIQLTLVDKDGNAVASPLNPVTRVFTLKPDPAEQN